MSKKKLFAAGLFGIGLAIAAATGPEAKKPSHPQEKKGGSMDTIPLKPFGLTVQDLSKATLSLSGFSPKTGAGKERIEILGTGEVRLIRSENYKAPEEVVKAQVKPSDVAALLALMETEGFMELDAEYKGGNVYSLRTQLKLVLPGMEKSVVADNVAAPQKFERMVGALKLLAGMASPLAVNRQYFFRL